MQEFEKLKELIQLAEADVEKAATGNKVAGTRARKCMQDIKKGAQAVRDAILASRESTPKGQAPPIT